METIIKHYEIKASKEAVFKALTTKSAIRVWSGADAEMTSEEGGEFSLWQGSIHGFNSKLADNQIIQQWKESNWEHFSTVTFNLKFEKGNTHLELIHKEIPKRSFHSMSVGWDQYYLGPLKEFLESGINQ